MVGLLAAEGLQELAIEAGMVVFVDVFGHLAGSEADGKLCGFGPKGCGRAGLFVADGALCTGLDGGDFALGTYDPEAGGGLLTAIYALAIFLPSLAVTIRRLHDTGRTGWWCLIPIVPCVGAIVLIVFLAQASERGSNAYGPDPREATA